MRALLLLSALALSGQALAAVHTQSTQGEPADTMQSEQEAAGGTAPGLWHGQWEVFRDDPALRTLGASRALELEIWHGEGEQTAQVQWLTGRAICPEIDGDPCEWIGAHGESEASLVDGHLYFALPLSADSEDPLFVHLQPPGHGAGRGAAANARGGIAFPLQAQRRE
jgi:hypothetical protein